MGNKRKKIIEILKDERTQIALGVFLAFFAAYLFLAMLSYLFTGAADQSMLYVDDKLTYDASFKAKNLAGKNGAYLSEMLVNNGFGLASFFVVYFLAIFSFHLIGKKIKPLWKTFIFSSFGLVWFSVALAFLVQPFFKNSFLFVGGKEGVVLSDWLSSYFGGFGTFIILLLSLGLFMIFAFDGTIPYLKNIFTRKAESENENENAVVESEPIVVTDTLVPEGEGTVIVEGSGNKGNETVGTETENGEGVSSDDDDNDGGDGDVNDADDEESDNQPIIAEQGKYDPRCDLSKYRMPPLSLLKTYENENSPVVDEKEQENKEKIKTILQNFGIEIDSITATVGPTITLYEIVPKAGVKVSKIKNIQDDIMLNLSATGIRIIAPIPGKGTVGIEVPNANPQIVSMHSVIASKKFQEESKFALPIALGRTITNEVFTFDLAKSPHLLVAGATGQGKSVGLNAIITSLLYKKHPSELKFVLVDPKMVEFALYSALEKHYMAAMPDSENIIITDSTKVVSTLNSLVIEMEDRYKLLMQAGCRTIKEYNEKFISRKLDPNKGHRFLPYIVIVIDEFGDFIMVAGKEVETPIARITQKARAVGMHMILATQRPSVNIITGIIKANVPGRIAFKVSSRVDSSTILDTTGAEQLVGKGDLLYKENGQDIRVQCAFVDTPEVEALVKYVSNQQSYAMPYQLPEYKGGNEGGGDFDSDESGSVTRIDAKFEQAARLVVQQGRCSTSYIQQVLELGFNRAARIVSQLEKYGVVGAADGSKPRKVLVDEMGLEDILLRIKQ